MAAVARGIIDETSNAVPFSVSAYLPVYLFVSLFVNLHFLSYSFSALNIIQGFSLNRLQRN